MLAVIQGLTEFLPISSSGHLALTGRLLFADDPGGGTPLWIEVALHVGTLGAVLVVYRAAVVEALRGFFFGGRPHEGLCVIIGTLPVVVVGFLFKDAIEHKASDGPFVGYGLLATACILTLGEAARRRRGARTARAEHAADEDPTQATSVDLPFSYRVALLIGLAQTIAILPGISRSGTTIAAGLVCGLGPAQAARFSFLLSIPAILGACLLTAKDADFGALGALGGSGLGALIWAMTLAGFVGWAALRVLIAFLSRGAFLWFAAYCALLALGVLLWL